MAQDERRSRPRLSKFGQQGVFLHYLSGPNREEKVPAKLQDYEESGCGLRIELELEPGTLVAVAGDFGVGGAPARREGLVVWCRKSAVRGCMMGILFSRPGRPKEETGHHRVPPRAPEEIRLDEKPDYYEILQLSQNADNDTLQRVYRALAQRYHPDNQATGNQEMFRRVLEAYHVLNDPEQRARYDVDYRLMKKLQWRIFDHTSASGGVASEKAKRRGILALLYTKRRNLPNQAGMSLFEIEEILGIPRDHLEFALWFLREAGQITRSDNQKYAITLRGVEIAEETGAWSPPGEKLIESPEAMALRESVS